MTYYNFMLFNSLLVSYFTLKLNLVCKNICIALLIYGKTIIYYNINMNIFLFPVPEPQAVQGSPVLFLNICLIFSAILLMYVLRPRFFQQFSNNIIKSNSNEPVSILHIFFTLSFSLVVFKYTTASYNT